jgi:hypothetical protein
VGCAPRAPPPLPTTWEYAIDAPAHGSRLVRVQGDFWGAGTDLLSIDGPPAHHVRDLEVNGRDGWRPALAVEGGWRDPACRSRCAVRYAIDLGELAAACDDAVDCAMRVGEATLSPALAWLVQPEPNGDARVVVRVHPADPHEFLTGMSAQDDAPWTYAFRSPDLDEGAFTAFGPMRRSRLDVRGASVDVAMLGGPMAMSDAEVAGWIADAANAASSLHARFPVSHAAVFVVPVPGEDEVAFGKVLSLSGASVALLVGDRMRAADARRDWVLVHELFHLGFPTFRGEGRWLEEGLATYYAPILRHRAGWTTEAELWTELGRKLPRGLPAGPDDPGLLQRKDPDALYWGGALFALLADLRIHEVSGGRRSLDDALRAVLEKGGNATQVWRVADVLRVGDEGTGTAVLRDTYIHHAVRGEGVDLPAILASLGVEAVDGASGEVVLREDRPLSAVRRAISSGKDP